jgi:hypothetical protein
MRRPGYRQVYAQVNSNGEMAAAWMRIRIGLLTEPGLVALWRGKNWAAQEKLACAGGIIIARMVVGRAILDVSLDLCLIDCGVKVFLVSNTDWRLEI